MEHIVVQISNRFSLSQSFVSFSQSFQSSSQSFYHVFNLFRGPSHSFVTKKVGISGGGEIHCVYLVQEEVKFTVYNWHRRRWLATSC